MKRRCCVHFYSFIYLVLLGHAAWHTYRILIPRTGVKPTVEVRSLHHQTAEDILTCTLLSLYFYFFFLINVAQLGLPPRLFCLVTFSFGAVLGLRGCARACSSCHVPASPCGGVSCRGAWAPGLSSVERRLSFSGTWTLPRRGVKPMSSALAGGFLAAGPPGKSLYTFKWLVLAYKNFTSTF